MQRLTSMLLVTCFFALITAPALVQTATEIARGQRPQVLDVLTRVPTADNLQAFEARLEQASVVGETLRPRVQYTVFRLFNDWGHQVIAGRDGWLFYRPGIESLTQRPSQDISRDGDPLSAIVSFRDQLAQRGIHLLVVPMPNKESIYPEQLKHRATHDAVIRAQPTRELFAQLRAADVDYVDIFEVFRQAKHGGSSTEPTRLYLIQDTHWSPAGAQLAAQAVAADLVARGWIGRAQTQYQHRPVRVDRLGDLVQMQRVPAIEQTLGAETMDCVQIVNRTNDLPYVDDPQSEVLVLGDSFLRIYQQDEPVQRDSSPTWLPNCSNLWPRSSTTAEPRHWSVSNWPGVPSCWTARKSYSGSLSNAIFAKAPKAGRKWNCRTEGEEGVLSTQCSHLRTGTDLP